ncbi:MAG: polysaccharide biosynthesis protein [Hyphomicrobiales bacterium]|nr:polysaccharide biosynthesis protein [Hyphomicrobiales bacterium]
MDFRLILVNLPRRLKRAVVIASDLFLFGFALWLGFSLRLSVLYLPPDVNFALLLLSAPLLGIITFHFMGVYKLVTRFIDHRGIARIYLATSLSVLIWSLVVFMAQVPGILPRSTFIIYWLLSATLIWSSRQFAGFFLKAVHNQIFEEDSLLPLFSESTGSSQNVLIYGAGVTGIQLAQALASGQRYQVVGFIDDNRTLWRQIVGGYSVYDFENIGKIVAHQQVKEIFLALTSIDRSRRRKILSTLEKYPVLVKILPDMRDIVSGHFSVSDLRPVNASDLLGRDPVPPNPELLSTNIYNKAVMITGAGGSIGSEIARQVLESRPSVLVLMDLSEVALYEIEQQVIQLEQNIAKQHARTGSEAVAIINSNMPKQEIFADFEENYRKTRIISVLGAVSNKKLMGDVITGNKIDTIYHAAAYKHVPMVELNPISGLENNTFGTIEIARAANEHGVERFVLVSTDKAVRPASIMGASKRLAEMFVQAFGEDADTKCIFTIVRFGNVLDSSGSVVRKFRQQIEAGGPITVTHKDVMRYFMSVTEAAQLVIQAGAMAKGGDVFILEMGKAVKIDNLARSMIWLSGLRLLDGGNPDGDIEIKYSGLRPGEKLFEELLIGDDTSKTKHPRIIRSNEKIMPLDVLDRRLKKLVSAMNENDLKLINNFLKKNVEGYHSKT